MKTSVPRDEVAPGAVQAPAAGGIGDTIGQLLEQSIARLEDPALPPGWVVHETRKSLKRVRALLRLSGDVLPTRRVEKRCAAAARKLAGFRDAAAIGETLARLQQRADDRQRDAIALTAKALASAGPAGSIAAGLPGPIAADVAASLRMARDACAALPFDRLDAAALDAGLAESRSDSAAAFRRVAAEPVLSRFHEFRKAVKRELHQRELCGRPLDRTEAAPLKKLADVLGELQDLDVLREALRTAGLWRPPIRGLAGKTMRELEARALRLGKVHYREAGS
jgi:CHAD domain-containing protein